MIWIPLGRRREYMSVLRRWSKIHIRSVLIPVVAALTASVLVLLYAFTDSDLVSPLPTLMVVDANGDYICDVRDGGDGAESGYWPLQSIPPRIAATVVAMEDRRFFRHIGVDVIAVGRAIRQNTRNGYTVSGASTLAMQVARLQHPAARTYTHKFREMVSAIIMTVRYGRNRIMDHYLRLAPYGNGIRGIGYAAYAYLGKPVEDLSWAEIAFLSAIPQQPNRMNPRTGRGRTRVIARARRIIRTVRDMGYMTEAEALRAEAQVADIRLQPRFFQDPDTIHLAVRYRDLFKDSAVRRTLPSPVVTTDIDLPVQTDASEQARLCVDAWSKSGVGNAAVMVLNARRMSVTAMVGSTGYFNGNQAGSIDYSRVKRSPGSTLKPFIYALALENGIISAGTMLADKMTHATGFSNFDGMWLGSIPVQQALASSRNVPAVDLLRQVGIHRAFGCFSEMGLHGHEMDAGHYGLGLAIGGMPVSMEHLIQAYSVFVNDGNLSRIRWYNQQDPTTHQRVFSRQTVAWINQSLSDPMARLPSFPRMGHLEYEYPVAVKTGTSHGYRDAWTVAWSPDYMVAVWLGRPDGQSMHQVGGYNAAAHLARVVMDRIHRKHLITGPSYFFEPDSGRPDRTAEVAPGSRSVPQKNAVDNQYKDHDKRDSSPVRITSPENGAAYFFDPDVPPEFSTLLLSIAAEVMPAWITWEIDGIPFQTVGSPFLVHWKMTPGTHRIKAVSSFETESAPEITIHVMSNTGTSL